MNDDQENKLSRARGVSAVLSKYQTELAGVPAMVSAQQALDASISLIGDLARAQTTATTGVTVDKANAQGQMMDTAFRVAGALKALAAEQNDNTLKAKVDINKSTFTRARDDIRDDIARSIHDLAEERLADLGGHGITAATLAGFKTRIDAYVLAIAKTRTVRGEVSTATSLLDQEVRRMESIQKDRLDGLMEQFKGSGTNFYSEYQNARKSVNTGSRSQPEEAPKPPTPPTS